MASRISALWLSLGLCLFFCFFVAPPAAIAKPIKVTQVSDLDFGTGIPGDFSKVIPAGTSENSTNGSFSVTGDANRSYSIVLPSSATLQTGKGPKSDTISISNFLSFPSGNGVLGVTGAQNVFVGATRSALRLTQKAGLYSGSYSITVVY